jgi:hypothetical protein
MVRLKYRAALAANVALFVASGAALAEEATPAVTDSVPGSEVLPGPGMSPQAPPVPPAAGGRAPSFGAPTDKSAATFRIGGRIFGYEAVGIGRKPSNPPDGYSGTALHTPPLAQGKLPFWGGAGATLNLQYGTPNIAAFVSYYFRMNRKEYQGYHYPQQGPGFGVAYLLVTPDPIGTLRLKFKTGSFVEVYGGPGQWGWGVFGPMLALRGYGETTNGEWDLTRDLRLTFAHGLLVVPGVPEDFSRGDYNSWLEPGLSSFVHHAHVGIVFKNQYTLNLHYASDYGANDRTCPDDMTRTVCLKTALGATDDHKDGRMDTYLAEARWQGDPWGQVGVTGGMYNFQHATSVPDGVWWAVDWTQGAKDMTVKYLGTNSNGNGKVAVIGVEYDFSVSRILWHPRGFNSQAPDIRVAIAGMLTRTVATDDPVYKSATGYFFGLETEYRMTSLFSLTFKTYGESRDSNLGRWSVYSLNPGIAYHSNWLSTDRIELFYGRRFYSSAVDTNSAQPLDRDTIVLGGYITF